MAADVVRTRVEGTTVIGTEAKHGRGRRVGAYGIVAVLSTALLIGGAAMLDRRAPQPTTPHVGTSQQTPPWEDDTTILPSAIAADGPHAVGTSQLQMDRIRLLLESVPVTAVSLVITTDRQRFLEVNTMLPEAPALTD